MYTYFPDFSENPNPKEIYLTCNKNKIINKIHAVTTRYLWRYKVCSIRLTDEAT